MEFSNSFTVRAPLSRVWDFMLDAQEVAPCVPGAAITESVDSLHHRGTVKIKLGAVQMTYRGELEMIPDEGARTIVLKARGTEARGSGGASGTFTTVLTETPEGTHVEIQTRVDVTGRVAQFGRGIMQDVANRMIRDFASCLEQKIVSREGGERNEPQSSEVAQPEKDATEPTPVEPVAPARAAEPDLVPEPAVAPVPRDAVASELRLAPLLADLARSRMAAVLHRIAARIEPKR